MMAKYGIQTYGGYLQVPHSDSINLTGSFTIETTVWIKSYNAYGGIISKHDSGYNGYGFNMHAAGSDQIRGLTAGTDQLVSSTFSIHNWHHLVLIYDASIASGDNLFLYIDGNLDSSLTITNPDLFQNTSNLLIGALSYATAYKVVMGMKNVRILKRALSENEIKTFAQDKEILDNDLVMDLRMDAETTDGKVKDYSGYDNHASFVGDSAWLTDDIGTTQRSPWPGWKRFNGNDPALKKEGTFSANASGYTQYYNNDFHGSTTAGDKLSFKIKGTGFHLTGATNTTRADFEVFVDGVSQGVYSQRNTKNFATLDYMQEGLEDTEHLIEFVVLDSRGFYIDAIDIPVSDTLFNPDQVIYQINNEVLVYNNVIYVDATNGSDDTGDGSKDNPYKTIQVGLTNSVEGDAIKLEPGDYHVTDWEDILQYAYRDFIGSRHDAVVWIDDTPHTYLDTTAMNFYHLNFYNLIFDIDQGFIGDYNKRTSAFFYHDLDMYFTFNNCVFKDSYNNLTGSFFILDGSSGTSPQYQKGNSNFEFCSIVLNIPFINPYLNPYSQNITINNSAFKSAEILSRTENPITVNNSITSATFDADYNITSDGWEHTGDGINPDGTQANIGVYGGAYAWGEWVVKTTPMDWGVFNKNLFGERYNIEKDNETGVITDNLQFKLSDGTIVPHEVIDYEKGLVRLKIPQLFVWDNKVYISYTDTPEEHSLPVPEGVTPHNHQVQNMKKKFETIIVEGGM